MLTPQAQKSLTFSVPAKVYDRFQKEAAQRGVATGAYAKTLFEAAFAARHVDTGDRTLDASVAATLLLYGAGMDTATIAEALKCGEHIVERVIHAWREEQKAA